MLNLYQCPHCFKTYTIEKRFLSHKCKVKERITHTTKTVEGQMAYLFYGKWIFIKHKRTVDDLDSFIESRYYNAFIQFAKFVLSIKGLADPDLFISLMVANKIEPTSWRGNDVFRKYLLTIERVVPVETRVLDSIDVLERIADSFGCELTDVFDHMYPNVLLQYIREQKISPWLLLNSRKFMQYLNNLNRNEQQYFEQVIDAIEWKTAFLNKQKQTNIIKQCLRELGL